MDVFFLDWMIYEMQKSPDLPHDWDCQRAKLHRFLRADDLLRAAI
jgi:hypothetical protein